MTKDEQAIGPHEGRELALMAPGKKPLAYFPDVTSGADWFPEPDFDALVTQGRLVKEIVDREVTDRNGRKLRVRSVFHALPDEEWRIKAMIFCRDGAPIWNV